MMITKVLKKYWRDGWQDFGGWLCHVTWFKREVRGLAHFSCDEACIRVCSHTHSLFSCSLSDNVFLLEWVGAKFTVCGWQCQCFPLSRLFFWLKGTRETKLVWLKKIKVKSSEMEWGTWLKFGQLSEDSLTDSLTLTSDYILHRVSSFILFKMTIMWWWR